MCSCRVSTSLELSNHDTPTLVDINTSAVGGEWIGRRTVRKAMAMFHDRTVSGTSSSTASRVDKELTFRFPSDDLLLGALLLTSHASKWDFQEQLEELVHPVLRSDHYIIIRKRLLLLT